MKYLKNLFIGVFMAIIGLSMFFQKLTFSDPSNNGMLGDILGSLFGNTSAKAISGVLFVIIFIMLLAFVFAPNVWTCMGLVFSVLTAVFVIVGSMSIKIADMSGLELAIIVSMVVIGIGMFGRSIVKLGTPNNA